VNDDFYGDPMGVTRRRFLAATGFALAGAAVGSPGAPPADLRAAMARHVRSGFIPGAVAGIWSGEKEEVAVLGSVIYGGAPMQRNTIFRIASTTKMMTAAAAMMLVDDGRVHLDEPVDRILPELASRRVLKRIDASLDDTEAARRSITLRDLLTLRLGLGAFIAPPHSYPIQDAMAAIGTGPAPFAQDQDEYMRRLGTLPLAAQPGTQWLYHTGMDVAGILVSRVSGKPLAQFMNERLFGPLGLKDTGFYLPAGGATRLAGLYKADPADGKVVPVEDAWTEFSAPPAFESGAGAGGLVSTLDDVRAFCAMMLNKGMANGSRVLSEASIREMTRNQLTPAQCTGQNTDIFFDHSSGWGLGMAVALRRNKAWLTPGRFGWDGGYGVSIYADPATRRIGILLTQRMMDSPIWPVTYQDFWTAAYRGRSA
jgi:CubicO group peptidase (beta-lactamase class C family)